MPDINPFFFCTERRLVALTGIAARNLQELLQGVECVPGSSIFYHTHQQYLSQHFQRPVFFNDFALWVSQALQEEALAERLAAIDLLAFTSIRGLRDSIAETIRAHLDSTGRPLRECPQGDEFHFCRSKSFILPTGLVAHTVAEFFEQLPQATTASLFFHFFEARLRLDHPTNDFSRWLQDSGEAELARRIDRLDPYIRTLDELKDDVIDLGRRTLAAAARGCR